MKFENLAILAGGAAVAYLLYQAFLDAKALKGISNVDYPSAFNQSYDANEPKLTRV